MWKLFRKKKKEQPLVINQIDEDYVVEFCYQWNIQYPIDRWWRARNNVAFNSPIHRSVSFIDMRFEYEEYMIFNSKKNNNTYLPDSGVWMKEDLLETMDDGLTEEEKIAKYKEEFKNIDLSQYND